MDTNKYTQHGNIQKHKLIASYPCIGYLETKRVSFQPGTKTSGPKLIAREDD